MSNVLCLMIPNSAETRVNALIYFLGSGFMWLFDVSFFDDFLIGNHAWPELTTMLLVFVATPHTCPKHQSSTSH